MGRLTDSIDRVRGLRGRGLDRWDPRLAARDAPRFPLADRRVLLAYLFSGLGDAALLAPVVKAVLDRGAKTPVGVLVPKSAASRLLEQVDLPMKLHLLAEGEGAEAKLERALRAKKYDVAADLSRRDGHDARRYLDATDAEVKLGFVREGERLERLGLTFGAADTRTEGMLHWSRYTALPLACLGVEHPSWDVGFVREKEAKKRALALFTSKRDLRVVLVPGGRAEEKRWDLDRFVHLGRAAIEGHAARVVVVGGPSEVKLVKSVAKPLGERARTYTGKDLATLIELVAAADVVITNDTGPMHLAFLLGVPTIAVFTYMSPLVWGPPRSDPRFVVINARSAAPAPSPTREGAEDVWTRLARHHLDGLLAKARR